MRKFVLALVMALTALVATSQVPAGDALDFGDMPPLPPPLLDDTPGAPALSPPESGAASPLIQPPGSAAASGGTGFGASTPPAVTPPAATMPSPLAPPSVPPLAPPPSGSGSTAGGGSLVPPAPPPLAPPPADTASGTAPTPALPANVGGVSPLAPVASITPAGPETPRTAKISGGRVNVRAGPNTQYESVAVLTTGTPVTVLAKNGDWFKIVYPAEQLASIHKNYVNADISGEIPEAGLPGVVSQDGADVHAYYWDKSTVVGKMNKGDPVTIKQERGQWYRIAAPASARAYVFAEYVKVDGADPVIADASPPPENPSVDLNAGKVSADGGVKLTKDDEKAIELKSAYYDDLKKRQAQQEEEARNQVNRLEQALDDFEARLRAIDQETSSQLYYTTSTTSVGSAAWAPADPVYGGYTGWVENIGRVGGAPASFRLSKGGEVRFYLRSDRYSLNDFTGRRVWVNGQIEPASGAVANVLNVDQIRILTDMEIAESVRQQQEATGMVQAPVAQPVQTDPLQASDPYAIYYDSGYAPAPVQSAPQSGYLQPTPVIPADPSQLPDVVGAGQTGFPMNGSIVGGASMGEVDSGYYEQPAISEIAP